MDMTVIVGQAPWQKTHASMFADGLESCGMKVVRQGRGLPIKTRMVACWSWHVGRALRQMGKDVLVMERGYLGDRFAWTSLGWNGLNNRASWPTIDDASRFDQHFAHLLKPWKTGGKYVLLIGQVPRDASLNGVDLSPWYVSTAQAAQRAYELPVRFRAHPMALKRGIQHNVRGAPAIGGTLEEALAGAAVTIIYNSNAGVDAIMAGCPLVALDSGTMAWPVAARRVGEVFNVPDELRLSWARRLAWCQWALPEIADGTAWRAVSKVPLDRLAA